MRLSTTFILCGLLFPVALPPAPALGQDLPPKVLEELGEATSAKQEEEPEAAAAMEVGGGPMELPGAQALFDEMEEDEEEEQVTASEVEADAQQVEQDIEEVKPPEKLAERMLDHLTSPYVETYLRVKDAVDSVGTLAGLEPPREEVFEFAPYIQQPGWFEAVAQFEQGRCTQALGLAQKVLGEGVESEALAPGLQYGLARMMWCGGEREKAREVFKALSAHEDEALRRLAQRALGEQVKAPAIQKEGGPGGAAGQDRSVGREIELAMEVAKKGTPVRALAMLEGLEEGEDLSSSQWYKVRLARAKLAEGLGDHEGAARVWRGVHERTAGWRSAGEIKKMIRAFERRSKLEVIGVAEAMDEMRELVSRGRYNEAKQISIDNAKRAGVEGSELEGWGLYRQALVAERKRDREQADALFGKAAGKVAHEEVRPKIYFGWARALRRMDRDEEAIALYGKLCEEYPHDALCPQAQFEAARLLQYHDKHEEALGQFFVFMGGHSDHQKMAEATWRAAFSAYLTGQWSQAEALLGTLEREYGEQTDASELTVGLKARYWKGMVSLRQGRTIEAMARFQDTIESGPLTWYGRLAAGRLEQLGRKPVVRLPAQTLGLDSPYHLGQMSIPKRFAHWGEAVVLSRLGFWGEVTKEVGRLSRGGASGDRVKRFLTNLQSVQGRPDLAHWTMKRMISERGPGWADLRDWGSAFPLHYIEFVHPWSLKYGVDPYLVQAIIRQESGFRQSVSSHAGAVGLMQLMPGTARYVARVFFKGGEKPPSTSRRDLIDPQVNVQLGTLYIRVHHAFAGENTAMALAGYNAGPAPLKRWFKQYGDREVDAWVESITYREARGYVRKVMTSYITYAGLYSGKLVHIPLEMPKSLGRWGQVPEMVSLGEAVHTVASSR